MSFKANNGFTLNDIIIAIFIFIIFSAIIASISYNIYINSNYVKRNSQATNYIVEVFEYAKSLSFEEVTVKSLFDYIDGKKDEKIEAKKEKYMEESKKSEKPYTMFINIDETFKKEKAEFIKKIDVTVMYKLGTKTKTVSMSTLINK